MSDGDRLPRAHEAERLTLGSIVAFPACSPDVFAILREPDFVDKSHRAIYAAMLKQHSHGLAVDPPLLRAELKSNPIFDGNPGALLLELGDSVATVANVGHYAKQIVEARRKRQLHQIAEAAVEGALNGHPANDVFKSLTADLDDFGREAQSVIELPKVSSIESRAVDWAWPGFLPKGMLTLCDGDPEKGKSQITCDVAARWTYPRPFPFTQGDHFRDAGNVLMVAAEDNADTTIRPRLEAAEANLERVYLWPEDAEPIKFPSGIDTLAAVVNRYDIGLVVLDPIGAYLDENVNANRDADVRRALRPLVALAEETNMAVLAVRHLNKDENKSAMYRGGGSIAFTAAARVVWAVGSDPNDSSRLVLAVLKSNIGIKPPSLTYTIEGVGTTSRIRWEGESTCTAGDIFNRKQQRGVKAEDAERLLRDLLAAGPRPEGEVREACHDAGIRDWTYKQARRRLGIQSTKGSMREGWLLSLPEEVGPTEEDGQSC